MRKLQVELDGKWEDVIKVTGGIMGFDRMENGTLASLRLYTGEKNYGKGVTFTGITDIRLVDVSEECEHSYIKNECDRCAENEPKKESITEIGDRVLREPNCFIPKPKIEKLAVPNDVPNTNLMIIADYVTIADKINEILERIK